MGSWETWTPNPPCCPVAVWLWPSHPPLGLSFLLVQRAGAPLSLRQVPNPFCSLSPQPQSSPDPSRARRPGEQLPACVEGEPRFLCSPTRPQAPWGQGSWFCLLCTFTHSFIHLYRLRAGLALRDPVPALQVLASQSGGRSEPGTEGSWARGDKMIFPGSSALRGGEAGRGRWFGQAAASSLSGSLSSSAKPAFKATCQVCVRSERGGACQELSTATQETLGLM